MECMKQLENEMMTQMEEILSHGVGTPDVLVHLFSNSVQQEMAAYGKS